MAAGWLPRACQNLLVNRLCRASAGRQMQAWPSNALAGWTHFGHQDGARCPPVPHMHARACAGCWMGLYMPTCSWRTCRCCSAGAVEQSAGRQVVRGLSTPLQHPLYLVADQEPVSHRHARAGCCRLPTCSWRICSAGRCCSAGLLRPVSHRRASAGGCLHAHGELVLQVVAAQQALELCPVQLVVAVLVKLHHRVVHHLRVHQIQGSQFDTVLNCLQV